MPWWVTAGVGVIAAIATALWWWLPKWQLNHLRLQDPKARADVEDNFRKLLGCKGDNQSELRLATQITSMNGIMNRATSVLGWSVTISLALIAWLASNNISAVSAGTPPNPANLQLFKAAIAVAGCTFATALCCIPALWPGKWRGPGHDPNLLRAATYGTEIEMLKAMASGYAQAASQSCTSLAW